MLYIGCAFRTVPDAQSRQKELLNSSCFMRQFSFPRVSDDILGEGIYLGGISHRLLCN